MYMIWRDSQLLPRRALSSRRLLAVAASQLVTKASNLLSHPPLLIQHCPLSLAEVLYMILQMLPRHGEVKHELVGPKLRVVQGLAHERELTGEVPHAQVGEIAQGRGLPRPEEIFDGVWLLL